MTGLAAPLYTCIGAWMRPCKELDSSAGSGMPFWYLYPPFSYQIYLKYYYHGLFIEIFLSFTGLGLRDGASFWIGSHQ